jgi:hypothetical protein
MVKSISYDQEEIIQWILDLHVPNKIIDLDPTYSKGNFYKGKILPPKYKYDIAPQFDDVLYADIKNLPVPSDFLNCIMVDLPFLSTTGGSLKKEDNNNHINKRFGVYRSEKELFQSYKDSLTECYRILKTNGILIFKCQDKISSSIQYMTHVFAINEAEKLGFYTKDMFILLAKNRLTAAWQIANQKNARKFHSYFLVFEKSNKKVKYI